MQVLECSLEDSLKLGILALAQLNLVLDPILLREKYIFLFAKFLHRRQPHEFGLRVDSLAHLGHLCVLIFACILCRQLVYQNL